MRLINTATGLLEGFMGDDVPEYAILSHTWEKDEISYQEYQYLTDPEFADNPKILAGKAKAGYIKIRGSVELAASKGIQYVWVDTCCIDKTSSADLTESINSMYQWYANSKVCFAYLVDASSDDEASDVSSNDEDSDAGSNDGDSDAGSNGEASGGRLPWIESRWFTRGWTLQELIAPREVEFYYQSWKPIGTKGGSCTWSLSRKTGIPAEVLLTNDFSSVCVAQKMSWASYRITTRKEDMAYCLLGLFGVNMPLMYGEGESAFLRLQEHIAASSTDHSLFAWSMPSGDVSETEDNIRSYRSIFARSPAYFGEAGGLTEKIVVKPDDWTRTNRGFHAVLPTIPSTDAKQLFHTSEEFPDYVDDSDHLVILNCGSSFGIYSYQPNYIIGIWVSLIDARNDGKHGFCRVTDSVARLPAESVSTLATWSKGESQKDLWFVTSPTIRVPRDYFSKRLGGFLIPTPESSASFSFEIHSLYASRDIGKVKLVSCPILPLDTSGGLVGVVTIKNTMDQGGEITIIFGYPPSVMKPVVKIVPGVNHRAPLEYDLEEHLKLGVDTHTDDDGSADVSYEGIFYSSVRFFTVSYKGMVFTQLDIAIRQ